MVLKRRALTKFLVLVLPMAGTISLPLAVPLLMRSAGIGAGVGLVLAVSCLWFAAMLRFAEMPGHE